MKILKFTFLLTLIITLISCGTSHNYTNNALNKNYYVNKTIYFKLNPKSQNQINFTGMVGTIFGGIVQPDVRQTFEKAISELAEETKLNLKYIDTSNEIFGKDNLIFDTEISEINWHFGFSVATLKTVTNFKEVNTNKEIKTIGIRKSGGGDEMNNLKKSLKDATFNFLKEFEKQ